MDRRGCHGVLPSRLQPFADLVPTSREMWSRLVPTTPFHTLTSRSLRSRSRPPSKEAAPSSQIAHHKSPPCRRLSLLVHGCLNAPLPTVKRAKQALENRLAGSWSAVFLPVRLEWEVPWDSWEVVNLRPVPLDSSSTSCITCIVNPNGAPTGALAIPPSNLAPCAFNITPLTRGPQALIV